MHLSNTMKSWAKHKTPICDIEVGSRGGKVYDFCAPLNSSGMGTPPFFSSSSSQKGTNHFEIYIEIWLGIGHLFLNHGNPHVPLSVLHCPRCLKFIASKFGSGSGGSGFLRFAIRCKWWSCFLTLCCPNICFFNLLLPRLCCCWVGFLCVLWCIYCFLFCIIGLRFFHCWVECFWAALCIFAFLVGVCICCGTVIFSVAFSCTFPTTFTSTSSLAFPCCVFGFFSIIRQPFCSIPGCLTNLACRKKRNLYSRYVHVWTDFMKGYIDPFAFLLLCIWTFATKISQDYGCLSRYQDAFKTAMALH